MFSRQGKAIKSPHEDSVQLALSRIVHEPVQFRARVLGTRLADIYVFDDGTEAPRHAIRSQVTQLHFAALVFGADAGVDSNSHRSRHTESYHSSTQSLDDSVRQSSTQLCHLRVKSRRPKAFVSPECWLQRYAATSDEALHSYPATHFGRKP